MWITPGVPLLPFSVDIRGASNPPRLIEEPTALREQAARGVQMPLAGATLLNRPIHQGDAHGGQGHSPIAVGTQVPLGSSLVALKAPKCIAGGVKTDYLSVGIRVGNHRVGLTADQARSPH